MSHGDAAWSYSRHIEKESDVPEEWPTPFSAPHTVDAWRHCRSLAMVKPLAETNPGALWLTVGDGNFGTDAHFLQSLGLDVTATGLTDERLRMASAKGLIAKYRAENAEQLSLPDNSADFVLCKESYHHFPRPPIAFYEMLRVARQGVILIEPVEGSPRVLDMAKTLAKKLLRGRGEVQFEPSGNFLFRVSIREIVKMASAINLEHVSFKYLNDCYLPWAAYCHIENSIGSAVTRIGIALQDLLCQARLMNFGMAVICVFKQPLESKVRESLLSASFTVLNLPKNPYI